MAYKYLEKLLELEDVVLRTLPLQGMVYGLLQNDEDWAKMREVFLRDTPLGDRYINVVCGFDDIFSNWVGGQINVALTVSWPRPPRTHVVEMLKERYDYICCPNSGDVKPLLAAGINVVQYLPIHTATLKNFFEEASCVKLS